MLSATATLVHYYALNDSHVMLTAFACFVVGYTCECFVDLLTKIVSFNVVICKVTQIVSYTVSALGAILWSRAVGNTLLRLLAYDLYAFLCAVSVTLFTLFLYKQIVSKIIYTTKSLIKEIQ